MKLNANSAAQPAVAPHLASIGNQTVMAYGDCARVYHVTERETAAEIQEEGFLGGWGDCGFGLYLYTTQSEARKYAERGGWDKSLKDPVVLVAHIPLELLAEPELHPTWNPAQYECVVWAPMDDDEEDEPLRPELLLVWDAMANEPIPDEA